MSHTIRGSVSELSKDFDGGWLLAELGPNDAAVRVTLQMK